jgi:hypothetical protein
VAAEFLYEEIDLPDVVGLMFTDMKPFTEVVGRSPSPGMVYGQEPVVIAFPKLRKGGFPGLLKSIQVKLEIVTCNAMTAEVAEFHCRTPTLLDLLRIVSPW